MRVFVSKYDLQNTPFTAGAMTVKWVLVEVLEYAQQGKYFSCLNENRIELNLDISFCRQIVGFLIPREFG